MADARQTFFDLKRNFGSLLNEIESSLKKKKFGSSDEISTAIGEIEKLLLSFQEQFASVESSLQESDEDTTNIKKDFKAVRQRAINLRDKLSEYSIEEENKEDLRVHDTSQALSHVSVSEKVQLYETLCKTLGDIKNLEKQESAGSSG